LNQGRIEMEFWTQLLSEWGAWPNGICLVTFGATLALNGLGCTEEKTTGCLNGDFSWTTQAIPMLFIMSAITQVLGTSLGLGALASSLDTDKYIMSREKWHIVHALMKVGYIPTKEGWKEDVYELAKSKNPGREPYFDRACALQHEWLEKRKKFSADKLTEQLEKFKWDKWIPLRYHDHLKYLLKKITWMEEKNKKLFDQLLKKKDKEAMHKELGMWHDVHKNKTKKIFQSVLVIIMVVCLYFGVLGFYIALDLEEAVIKGLDFLWEIDIYYWISAVLFAVCSCIYYWDSLKRAFWGTFTGLRYFIRCCPVDDDIETGFLTPVHFEGILDSVRSRSGSKPDHRTFAYKTD